MASLDNAKRLARLDRSGMRNSISALAKQFQQAWQETKKVTVPAAAAKAQVIVVQAMGGSALGADVIQFLCAQNLRRPLVIIRDYTLPAWVGPNTLYIAASYSGTTEEVLAGIAQAKKKKATIAVIAAGGALGKMVTSGQVSGYIFKPTYNPSGQPRIGVGYAIGALAGLLRQAKLLTLSDREVTNVLTVVRRAVAAYGPNVPKSKNQAKRLAERLEDSVPCIVAADFLTGNAHVLSNQFHETAKHLSMHFPIPELNHHLLEGLAYPKKSKRQTQVLFFQSALYHPRNQRRIEITKDVVENNGLSFYEYQLTGKTKLEQSMEMLVFGSYVTFYLALLHGLDPGPNPWVDYLKEQLAKKK